MQNRLDDLPLGISDMNKLQILKVAGNPLRYPLRRLLESSETEFAPSSLTDNEKEVAVTAELKRFLKTKQPVAPLEIEKYDPRYVLLSPLRSTETDIAGLLARACLILPNLLSVE